MSARSDLAGRLAAFLRANDLCQPLGGIVVKRKNSYALGYSQPTHTLSIEVWGERFILIQIKGARNPGTGVEWSEVYQSEADALAFLRLALVERDNEKARAIPTKPRKSDRTSSPS